MKQIAVAKNIVFFRDHGDAYAKSISKLDTYTNIGAVVASAVNGANQLLDVGNGLVFHYDVNKVKQITALDLFANSEAGKDYGPNIKFKKGSALNIPEPKECFDTVLMEMLLHHLVDKNSAGSMRNMQQAIAEGFRVLKPGGKLIVVESCVPFWFFWFEKAVYSAASRLVDKLLFHPMAFQYPQPIITEMISAYDPKVTTKKIPKGKWLIQFGFKYPGALTPIDPWIFIAHKKK